MREGDRRFGRSDLDEWVAAGLIRPDQLDAILAHLAGIPYPVPEPGTGGASRVRERAPGLNLVTVAYYFGAFLILLAWGYFLGLRWEDLGDGGRAAASGLSVAVLLLTGAFLRRHGYPTGGNLLVFAGVAIVPLAVHSLLRLAGFWPEPVPAQPGRHVRGGVDANWLILEISGIVSALLAAWWTRFPLMTLPAAAWTWLLSMDLAGAAFGHERWRWDWHEWSVGVVFGLAMLVVGLRFQQRQGGQEWSRWFYLFGHVAILGNLGALALDAGTLGGLLFLAVYLGFVVDSVRLQSRTFLVFGAIGCYAYVSKLALDTFSGSLGFVYTLAAIGLIIVVGTVAFQRYLQPWLSRTLVARTG